MKYRSLNQPTTWRTFGQALREGLAPNRGLYVPENIPLLPDGFLRDRRIREDGPLRATRRDGERPLVHPER